MKKIIGSIVLIILNLLIYNDVYAVEPAKGDETLCDVQGVVQSVMQEEMDGAASGARVLVPVVVLEVSSVLPVDAAYTGQFCQRVTGTPATGVKPVGYYRLCDAAAEFMTGQTIKGVVGTSKGGGRYCIAQISVLP